MCGQTKPHTAYHKDKKGPGGLGYYCKECALAKSRKWHAEHISTEEYRDRKRSSYMKMNYGITLVQRTELIAKQGYKCAICGIELKLEGTHTHTDHCHKTGIVRGILCTNCNRGLGHFKDSQINLRAAISYLARTEHGTQKEVTNP